MEPIAPPPKVAKRKRRRKLTFRLLAIAGGVALGELCPLLPVEKQMFCHFAAKLAALLWGAG